MAEDPSAPRDDASAQPKGEPEAGRDQQEPGAPVPADAVDPELLRLPPPRPRRSPILGAAVVILGVLLLVRLHADLAYTLQPSTPEDLGDARAAVRSGKLGAGRFVTLSGMPDHRNALSFEAKGERSRSYLFRLLGTGSRVLVVTTDSLDKVEFENRFSGRLRRFADLPYGATIAEYYQREARALRALDLSRLRALPDGELRLPLSLPDRAGDPLSIAPTDELLVDVLFPDDLRVLLSRDKFPSEPDARHEVERLGLPAGPGVETRDGYGYVLRLPPGPAREQAIEKVDKQGMLLQGRVETYRIPASALRHAQAGLLLPGPDRLPQPTRYKQAPDAPGRLVPLLPPPTEGTLLPWEQIRAVQISEPLTIPGDAFVLLSGETPGSVRWTLPVAALLVLFIAFNLWYLLRGLVARRHPE